MLLTALFTLFTQTAQADSWPEYITDVVVCGASASNIDGVKQTYTNQGYTFCSMELNEGSGGDWIYVGYKKGSRASTNGGYITDFYISNSSSSSIYYNGRTYYPVPTNSGFNGDLNSGARGDYIYLYYTKNNFSDKRAVSSISFDTSSSNAVGLAGSSSGYDLNAGAGGEYVYMHFSTTTKTNRPTSDPTMQAGLVYNGQPQQLVKYNPTSCTMYYRVGTSGNYSSTVSDVTATNASSYTVYYYAGSDSYGDASSTHSQTVTIAKSPNNGVTVSCTNLMEGNAPQPTLGGTNLSTGAVTYKYSTSQSGSYTTTVPTTAGTYWVKATIASDANCNEYTTAAASFTMTPDWAVHNSGDSEADAYVINTTADLDLLASRVNSGNQYANKYFKLGGNITYTHTSNWNDTTSDENNFSPIGNNSNYYNKFAGHFDGGGYTISGIRIYSYDSHMGLFGYITGSATITGVKLADTRITAYKDAGGIVGENNGTVSNCYVKSNVMLKASSDNSENLGGIVGYTSYGGSTVSTFSGCRSETTLSGGSSCKAFGAIVGYIYAGFSANYKPIVKHNLAIGATVPSTQNHGAIIGSVFSYQGNYTSNYYANCTVAGAANAADVGYNGRDVAGVRKAVAINAADGVTVTPTGTATTYNVSGITAYEGNNAILYNGQFYAGATELVRLNVSYDNAPEDYVFRGYTDGHGNALTANDDNTYTLAMTTQAATVTPDGVSLWGTADDADGSQQHPYVITTTAGLDLLSQKVNAGNKYSGTYFELGDDLTYDKTVTNNFTSIGNASNYFSGHFDGKGHTVSGILIGKGATDYVGFFGLIYDGAEIKNLTIDNSQIVGRKSCGGIVGRCQNSSVTNCHVTSSVTVYGSTSFAENHGGIVGENFRGQVTGCTSGAMVKAASDLSRMIDYGGIVGENYVGIVENCLVYGGTINGLNNVGAVVGYNNSGTLTNNRYTGFVTRNGSQAMLNDGVGEGSQDGTAYACALIPYEGVTLNVATGEATTIYDYDGLKIYPTGMSYGGTWYNYIANGDDISGDVTFTATYTGSVPEGYALSGFGSTSIADNPNVSMNWAATDGIATCTLSTYVATFYYIAPIFNEIPTVELADNNEDNSSIIPDSPGQTCNVVLKGRTLRKDGQWQTICLPFDVDMTDPEGPLYGATYRTVTNASIEGTTLNLTFGKTWNGNPDMENTLVAGRPYFIKWDKAVDYVDDDAHNIVNPVFTNVNLERAGGGYWSDDNSVWFIGDYDALIDVISRTIPDYDVLLLGADNKLHYAGSGASLGACRACFLLQQPQLSVDVNGDGQTSIADVTALVNMVLGKSEITETADVNGDGQYSIADVTALVNMILGKGQKRVERITTNVGITVEGIDETSGSFWGQ